MPRHIFSINSGRSGSEYLARVLATARNVASFHEPAPDGAGFRIKRYPATRPTLVERALYPPMYVHKLRKVQAIRRVTRDLPPDHVYAETNHMFILSFRDVIMRHVRPVDIILLRRYLPATVRSFIQLDHFTPRCPFTKNWFASPNSPSAAVQPLAPDDEMDQVDRIIGYLIDVEGRAARFRARYPATRVVEVRLAHLNSLHKVREMFAALDLEDTPETARVVGRVVNDKPEHKARIGKRVSLAYCRDRIEQYIEKCARKGIRLPELPALREVEPVGAD